MRVLVTGGAGYIGSVTSEELIQAGHEVIVFDNLSQGHRAAVPPGAAFVEGDLAMPWSIGDAISHHKPEAIMHFAAHLLVGESMEKPFKYLGDNVTNGLNLIQAAVAHGIKRFILSSTANLFDHPDRLPIDESAAIRPGSPYGESKHILERMLYWLDRTSGLRHACLRYFNAAGATADRGEDHEPEAHLVPRILGVALKKLDRVTIYGGDYETHDGTCVRDYIHVSDLARAHILALTALEECSRTYNLGNGRGFSVLEVVEAARAITGHPIPVEIGPRRPGDPPVLVAGSDKIRRELGWETRFPDIHSIVESAWNWHRTHPDGYGDRRKQGGKK